MRRFVAAAVTLAALGSVGACGVAPEPSTAPLKEATPSKEASASPAADTTQPLTGKAPVGDTMTVRLAGVKRGNSGQIGSPPNTPYVAFKVTLTNDGPKAVDPMMLMISCVYGKDGTTAEDVYYDGMGDIPTVKVLPGKSVTFDHACTLPSDETALTIQAQDVTTDEAAVFEGSVK